MTTSKLPDVIDALVTRGRALSGHRDPTVRGTGIPVFDGPEYGILDGRPALWVAIGWGGDPDAPEDSAEAAQELATAGNPARQRDEIGVIAMRVTAQYGDRSSMKTVRDAVFGELALFEDLFRTTPTLGLSPAWMRWVQFSDRYRLRQSYNNGPVVTWTGGINFRTFI